MRLSPQFRLMAVFGVVAPVALVAAVMVSLAVSSAAPSPSAPAALTVSQGFDEQTEDTDGDGLIDTLILSPTISIPDPGQYMVNAALRDGSGVQVYSGGTGEVTLAAGTQKVRIAFAGKYLYQAGRSGPYTLHLTVVHYFERHGQPASAIEVRDATVGQTAAYDYTRFQHERIVFDPRSFAARAIDTDGDGLYEQLVISGRVTVDAPGAYVIDASIYTPQPWKWVAFASTHVQLIAGDNAYQLAFAGADIARAGLDGPYVQPGPLCYPVSNADLTSGHTPDFKTPAYKASQFGS